MGAIDEPAAPAVRTAKGGDWDVAMRFSIGLIIFIVGIAGFFATPAQAGEWCGFHDTDHSVVRCGFSSQEECRQTLGVKVKDVVCAPDPEFAGMGAPARGRSIALLIATAGPPN